MKGLAKRNNKTRGKHFVEEKAAEKQLVEEKLMEEMSDQNGSRKTIVINIMKMGSYLPMLIKICLNQLVEQN